MNPNEILTLVSGIAFGAQLMNAVHAFWGWRDARRGATAARRQRRILDADQFHRSLRLYRLQHRSPA
ncbi:hypothetical protein QA811_17775 [Streptomyces sp. B21-102]|uniref:hypothetical protein n=1 Tax=Streptomyces sp. B21-102 TaxID=3039416 RepID=UPI002FEF9244